MTINEHRVEVLDVPYTLSAEDVDGYHANGWLRLPTLLDTEVIADLNGRFDGLYEQLRQQGQKGTAGDQYFTNDRYHRQHRIFDDPALLDETFRRVVTSERIASVARQLLRSDHAMYLRSTVFEKPPAVENSLPTTLHQDYPYLPFDRSGSMQFWIALHDLPVNSGTLRFVSGSHRSYGVIGRTNVSEHEQELLKQRFGSFETTAPQPMQAGHATVHDDLTVHGADANEWDRARRGFTVTYVSADVKYTGADWWVTDGLGLQPNELIRHERFPII